MAKYSFLVQEDYWKNSNSIIFYPKVDTFLSEKKANS